jgi:diacylglycerol kinase family enzyme
VVRIDAGEKRLVETDGSVIGTTPIEISIVPAALSVLVPADEA